METAQHSRPIWIGLIACALFVPSLMAILQMFSAERSMIAPVLVFIVGVMISGSATLLAATPIVLLLRRAGWLNVIALCVLGTAVGALALGMFAFTDNQYPQMNDQTFARWIARQAALKAMVPGAIYGFLSASALCVGAGVAFRPSRSRGRGSA